MKQHKEGDVVCWQFNLDATLTNGYKIFKTLVYPIKNPVFEFQGIVSSYYSRIVAVWKIKKLKNKFGSVK